MTAWRTSSGGRPRAAAASWRSRASTRADTSGTLTGPAQPVVPGRHRRVGGAQVDAQDQPALRGVAPVAHRPIPPAPGDSRLTPAWIVTHSPPALSARAVMRAPASPESAGV